MGNSRPAVFVDLETGAAVESHEASAAAAARDALIVGGFLGGLLFLADFTILLCFGLRSAVAAAIVFTAVVLLVMWDVRRTGPYPLDEEAVDRTPAPAPFRSKLRGD
jgi:predicted lipid-binding transport protein (Tim44 family)